MPANKNAWIRYLVIIKRISNGGATKNEIQKAIRNEIGIDVSISTIEKDIYFLRYDSEFGVYAPIVYRKDIRAYWLQPHWKLSDAIRKVWRI